MSVVPIVPSSAESPRASRLALQLKETIESFRREDPATSATDVRRAMSLATRELGSDSSGLAFALIAALGVFGVLTLFFFASSVASFGLPLAAPIMIGIVIAVLFIASLLKNR